MDVYMKKIYVYIVIMNKYKVSKYFLIKKYSKYNMTKWFLKNLKNIFFDHIDILVYHKIQEYLFLFELQMDILFV